ncbi:MAG: glycosyltransferase [Cyclobacteriaceae bacterium]|jgi:glycosyltransferase involved in cell wall biosynthesis|nr:glycosyltransferase [Cyclobacteriaceae bacterium]
MHVLIISHNYPYELDHTFGFFCKQQADALIIQGHKVGAVIPLPYSLKLAIRERSFLIGLNSEIDQGVRKDFFLFPSVPKAKRLKFFIIKCIGIYLLNRYIKKYGKPDIIHLHTYLAGEVCVYAKDKYNIPIVYTEHFSDVRNNFLTRFERNLVSLCTNNANARIAVSEDFRIFLEKKFNKSFVYIPNVYNNTIFKLPIQNNVTSDFTFIHVAHISPIKNQKRLLSAFQIAFHNRKDVKLIIIGSGSDKPGFKQLIKSFSIKDQVITLGSLSAEDVYKNLCLANCFVLSSDKETFGVSIIEALACGLPIISTKCGGPESILKDKNLGLLTEQTSEAMAEAMQTMVLNFKNYNKEVIASFAKDNFSYETIGAKLTKIYEQCISAKNEKALHSKPK